MRIEIDGTLKFFLSEYEDVLTIYDDDNEIIINMTKDELDRLRSEIR